MKLSNIKAINRLTGLFLTVGLFTLTHFSPELYADELNNNLSSNTGDEARFIAKAPKNIAFNVLDTDSDKRITLGEAKKDYRLMKFFDVSDVNQDGAITVDEYAQYKSKQSSVYLLN